MKIGLTLLLATAALPAQTVRLDTASGLQPLGVKVDSVPFLGKPAVRVTETQPGSTRTMAILSSSDFADGTIQVSVAGAPHSGATETARGFIGIAFRVQPDTSYFECFYIRPTNGRAEDQLRRNHSIQYISNPDFPWERLRQETPGVYESYADMQPATWIQLKIVVDGVHARLYLNGADQPSLIVNDLKLGKSRGKVALWIGPETDSYFSNLVITK
jgi:hypothetical protein